MPTLPIRLAAACALLLAASPALAQTATPQGVWLTASGNLQVQIAPCGDVLCGVAVKVLANNSMSKAGAAAAGPATVGLKLISDLKPVKPGTWQGHLLNRENGKTYDCLIEPQGDALKIRAYVGAPMFGKDQVWRRVP